MLKFDITIINDDAMVKIYLNNSL